MKTRTSFKPRKLIAKDIPIGYSFVTGFSVKHSSSWTVVRKNPVEIIAVSEKGLRKRFKNERLVFIKN